MKRTPFVLGRRVQPDSTIMQFDDVVNDEQTQAAAAKTASLPSSAGCWAASMRG